MKEISPLISVGTLLNEASIGNENIVSFHDALSEDTIFVEQSFFDKSQDWKLYSTYTGQPFFPCFLRTHNKGEVLSLNHEDMCRRYLSLMAYATFSHYALTSSNTVSEKEWAHSRYTYLSRYASDFLPEVWDHAISISKSDADAALFLSETLLKAVRDTCILPDGPVYLVLPEVVGLNGWFEGDPLNPSVAYDGNLPELWTTLNFDPDYGWSDADIKQIEQMEIRDVKVVSDFLHVMCRLD